MEDSTESLHKNRTKGVTKVNVKKRDRGKQRVGGNERRLARKKKKNGDRLGKKKRETEKKMWSNK